jgi:hypothetical protein
MFNHKVEYLNDATDQFLIAHFSRKGVTMISSLTIPRLDPTTREIKEVHLKKFGFIEKAAVNREYEEKLSKPCKIEEEWCPPKKKAQRIIAR